ncbi:MAG: TonB-dependent receptor [Cyclobacteriaceae bacterium]
MQPIKTIKWFLFTLITLLVLSGQAQQPEKKPVRSILDRLERQYAVNFTYMDQTIDSLSVSPPDEKLNLKQSLFYLENAGGLQFVFLDDDYISVRSGAGSSALCGYLIDSESGDPIPEALVYVGENFTTTDQNGYFTINNTNPSETVLVSHVSYEKAVLSFTESMEECTEFYLKSTINTLSEIVIQSYITRGINKKSGGEIEVDVQHTNILPGLTEPDVFFLLQNLPGIQSINETVSDINIRGGSNDQNLVLWDGMRLYQTSHFFGLISAINPYTIHKSSLIKNGTSAELGEGVSGTIQVETSDEQAEKISFQAGSNLINADQLLKIPFDKTSLTIASRQSLSGLVLTPTYKQYFERAFRHSEVINNQVSSQVVNSNEQFDFYDLSINAIHDFSTTTKLKTGFLILDNTINYEESAVVNSKITSRVSGLNQGSYAGYLTFNHRWNDRLKTQIFGSISNYEQKSINFDVLTNQEHVLENEVLETSLKAVSHYYVTENWDLSSGIQWVETGIRNYRDINTPEFRSLSKEVMRTTSLFVENNINPFTNTELTLGLRTSYFDKIALFRVEPRISVLVKLGESMAAEFLAESKSQTTVQTVDFQTDFLGIEKRKWELINGENIPLITSNQASIGINYNKKFILLSLEGYYKEVNGIITSSQGFLNQYQFVRSAGSYSSSGIEMLINPRLGKLDGWITYTFLNSDYTFPELATPEFRNNFDISHAITAGMSYSLQDFEFSSGINYRSGLPYTGQSGLDQNGERILFDSPNNLILDPYFRLDLSAKYSFNITDKIKGKCGLAIWNLTNKDNTVNGYYQLQDGDLEWVSQLALGITPNVNFRIIYNP